MLKQCDDCGHLFKTVTRLAQFCLNCRNKRKNEGRRRRVWRKKQAMLKEKEIKNEDN